MNKEQEYEILQTGLIQLVKAVEKHCLAIQSGWAGAPSMIMMQQIGQLHADMIHARSAILSTEKPCEKEIKPFREDTETKQMLDSIPYVNDKEEYAKSKVPNAFVYKDCRGRIGIFPTSGGWIGAKIEHFDGDVAPFAG